MFAPISLYNGRQSVNVFAFFTDTLKVCVGLVAVEIIEFPWNGILDSIEPCQLDPFHVDLPIYLADS